MDKLLQDLEQWFNDKSRPLWLRNTTNRLLAGKLTEDLSSVIDLCKKEAAKQLDSSENIYNSKVSLSALRRTDGYDKYNLLEISDVKGVNALNPKKPLQFKPDGLTIIFGMNGSGKSGYARILRHVSGASDSVLIHQDVFHSPAKQECCFKYQVGDDNPEIFTWSSLQSAPPFGRLAIFDTSTANMYVTSENEVAYEPPLLRVFTQLTDICAIVNNQLQAEIDKICIALPAFPSDLNSSTVATWYGKLDEKISDEAVATYCVFSSENEKTLKTLEQQLAEKSPSEKAIEKRSLKIKLLNLHTVLSNLYDGLSDMPVKTFLEAKSEAHSARKTADEDANLVFNGSVLTGIGSESWRRLWQAAREYSNTEAYKGRSFPVVGNEAVCVLCQQSLTKDISSRIITFEQYVLGELQAYAIKAEKTSADLEKQLPNINDESSISLHLDACQIKNDEIRNAITTFVASLRKRKAALLNSDYSEPYPELPSKTVLDTNAVQNTCLQLSRCCPRYPFVRFRHDCEHSNIL